MKSLNFRCCYMMLYICKIKEESESMIVDKHSTLLHSNVILVEQWVWSVCDIIVSCSTVQTSAFIIDQSLDVGIFSHNYYQNCKDVSNIFIQVIGIRPSQAFLHLLVQCGYIISSSPDIDSLYLVVQILTISIPATSRPTAPLNTTHLLYRSHLSHPLMEDHFIITIPIV